MQAYAAEAYANKKVELEEAVTANPLYICLVFSFSVKKMSIKLHLFQNHLNKIWHKDLTRAQKLVLDQKESVESLLGPSRLQGRQTSLPCTVFPRGHN